MAAIEGETELYNQVQSSLKWSQSRLGVHEPPVMTCIPLKALMAGYQ